MGIILMLFLAPLHASKWINVTSNLKGMNGVQCGQVVTMCMVPGKDKVLVGTAMTGIFATTDGGATWVKMGSGAGSDNVNNKAYTITFDPTNADIFWVSGQYGGYAVYKTTDGGNTFHHLGLTDGPSGQTEVDFADPARKTLLVGSIERMPPPVWKSRDGGVTFTNIGTTLPAGVNFAYNVNLIDSLTYVVYCGGYGSGTNGIYRTTDAGASWIKAADYHGYYPALVASDGSIYLSLYGNGGLIRSTNKGVSWTQVVGSGIITPNTPIELPDHRLVAVGTRQQLLVSTNHGAGFVKLLDSLPVAPIAEGRYACVYDSARNSFFIHHWNCTEPYPDSLVWRYDCTNELAVSVKPVRQPERRRQPYASRVVITGSGAKNEPGLLYTIRGQRVNIGKNLSRPASIRRLGFLAEKCAQ
jgi:photosystem II stability/assembly factor-like uncharacterized protein